MICVTTSKASARFEGRHNGIPSSLKNSTMKAKSGMFPALAALPLSLWIGQVRADTAAPPAAATQAAIPSLTPAEFDHARQIYFERCAGCHGVLRKGATGKPLTPDITRERGTEYLKTFIKYGSPAGMPNWGTSGDLSDAEVDLMARYIQLNPPTPPEFSLADIEKSRKDIVPVAKRPTRKMNAYNLDNLFSVTLRDAGEVALIG